MDTSEYQDKYLAHHKLWTQYKQNFSKGEVEVSFPISEEILNDFSERLGAIYTGIYCAILIDNLYSALILYRSLLEHYYKALYITEKMMEDKSDDVATNYQQHYFISEMLAEKAGVNDMQDLITGKKDKTDFVQFINADMPELEGFAKENQQEVSAGTVQFQLKKIVAYLYNKHKNISPDNHILAKTLPEYSQVSTFVHGGPYATTLIAKYKRNGDTENEMRKILDIGLTCVCSMKENYFLVYKPTTDFFPKYYNELKTLRQ